MANDVLDASQETTDLFGTMREENQKPPIVVNSKMDPKTGQVRYNVDADPEVLGMVVKALQFQARAVGGMQQEVDRLQAQEQRARQNPLLNILATVGGNLAVSDPRLPPLVSALGRSSLQLNPTPDELARRRVGLEEQVGRSSALLGESANRILQEQRLERRTQAEIERNQRNENIRMFSNLSAAAQKGELTDKGLVAKTLSDIGVDLQAAESQAAQLVAVSQAKRELDDKAQAARDERERRALAERAREADNHMATILKGIELRTEAQMKLQKMKTEEAERKATAKTEADRKKIPATLPDKLANLTSAEKALDEVEAGLRKYSAYQGVFAGRVIEPVASYLKTDVSKFFTKMKLQVAQAIKSTGAGARGFGPMERGFFEKLAEAKTHSAAENLGIIQAWRDYVRQNRAAYLDTYEGLQDPKWRRAFGKNADLLDPFGAPAEEKADPLGVR